MNFTMYKKWPLALILFALSFAIVGCDDEEAETLDQNISLKFNATFDGEPLNFNEARMVDDHRFEMTTLNFYVSNIVFVKADGTEDLFPDPVLINLGSTISVIDQINLLVEPGDYESVRFAVGLDETANAVNAEAVEDTSSPISATQNMYWGWAKAYVFIKLEGRYDFQELGTEVWDQSFAYHMGHNTIYNEVSINFNESVSGTERSEIELDIDVKDIFFSDTNPIDIDTQPTSHVSESAFVTRLSDNFVAAFE